MSRQVSPPSPDTAFAIAWSRLFPPEMVQGTASEPIALDDTPSPRRSQEPTSPPNPLEPSIRKAIIIIDSDEERDELPLPAARTVPISRLASRSHAHPWKSSKDGRETPPQSDQMNFGGTRSGFNSPSHPIRRTPKPSPKAAANIRQVADSPQRQAIRNSRTPSGQASASNARITASPLALSEDSPRSRSNRNLSSPIPENLPRQSPQHSILNTSRTPSQKVQTPHSGMDASPMLASGVNSLLAGSIHSFNSPISRDVVMQDETIHGQHAAQHEELTQRTEIFQEDEVMQDIVEGSRMVGELGERENHEIIIGSTVGTKSPLSEQIKLRRFNQSGNVHADVGSMEGKALEYHLRQFEVDMEKDHATTVRWLLHDARRASSSISRFADEESPFISAESVSWILGTPVPAGYMRVKLETHVSHLPTISRSLINDPIVVKEGQNSSTSNLQSDRK